MTETTRETFALHQGDWTNPNDWHDPTADQAFREGKKTILNPLMKAQGFLQYKGNSFVRLGKNQIVQEVELQKMSHGKNCTINLSFFRLDCPPCRGMTDCRISQLLFAAAKTNGTDVWWSFTAKYAQQSFLNMADAIRLFVLPWFTYYEDPERYRAMIQRGGTEDLHPKAIEARDQKWPMRERIFDPDSTDEAAVKAYLNEQIAWMDTYQGPMIPVLAREKNAFEKMLSLMEQGMTPAAYHQAWIEANMAVYQYPKGLLKQIL